MRRGYILKSKKRLFRIMYYEKLNEVRCQDVYHKALVYCLGICNDTRRNINSIYDFERGLVKPKCLHAEKLDRLSALNELLNMDEKGGDALGMDDEPEQDS